VDEVKVGIAGLGYWGPNLVRNFRTLDSCRVTAVADLNEGRREHSRRVYPDIETFETAETMIESDDVDAVVLALPAQHIPDLGVLAIKHGKHVIVEKPMAHSLEEGLRMRDLAADSSLVTMVDFTFVFSPPVRYMKSLLGSEKLGDPQYYQSSRINLGRFQPDIDVIWDLVTHDVAILLYLLEEEPQSVMATGRGRLQGRVDTAHVTLAYENGFQAFIHVSWMAPTKVRLALLSCREGMVVYNDVEPDEKIRVCHIDEAFDPDLENPLTPTFRLGDVLIPSLPRNEPLSAMAETFIDAIHGKAPPTTDWNFGSRVLRVLEAARQSLERQAPVSL
jgi:predicted dehydrogenase